MARRGIHCEQLKHVAQKCAAFCDNDMREYKDLKHGKRILEIATCFRTKPYSPQPPADCCETDECEEVFRTSSKRVAKPPEVLEFVESVFEA